MKYPDDHHACEGEGCYFFDHHPFRIHAHVFGSGPPVVLVHGFPEYWASWKNQIDALAGSHLVILLDLPGVNLSLAPDDLPRFTAQNISSAVLAFISHLKIARFSILGHDIGGLIAWWCAGIAPARVERLALLSSPHPADYISLRSETELGSPPDYADLILAGEDAELFNPQRLSFWTAGTPAHALQVRAMARSNFRAMGNYYRANLNTSDLARWSALERPVCPTTLIYGDRDPFIESRFFESAHLRAHGAITIRKLAGMGHFLHTSATAMVNRELQAWLSIGRR